MPMTAAEAVAAVMLVALVVYALFGGADYGAGMWDLLARGPRAAAQRELIAQAIGPVWEANYVWLIIVIVLLFTGFPAAFAAVMTTLHVPLSLMLIGVVLRGSAFTFRSYDNSEVGRRRWNRVFSISSVVTPILLGAVIGAIATGEPGRAAAAGGPVPLLATWLGPFPLAVGLFALNTFAFVAAVYLTLEAPDPALSEDFRARALAAAVTLGGLAWVVYHLSRTEAPLVSHGLAASP
jgi:cytochrome d ubiquinol oxidase subunit II